MHGVLANMGLTLRMSNAFVGTVNVPENARDRLRKACGEELGQRSWGVLQLQSKLEKVSRRLAAAGGK